MRKHIWNISRPYPSVTLSDFHYVIYFLKTMTKLTKKYRPTYLPVYQATTYLPPLRSNPRDLCPFSLIGVMRWHDLTKMYFSKLYIYPNCILCTRLTHLLSFTSLFMLKKTNSCWFAIVIWFQGLNSGEFEVLNSGLRFYCKKFNQRSGFHSFAAADIWCLLLVSDELILTMVPTHHSRSFHFWVIFWISWWNVLYFSLPTGWTNINNTLSLCCNRRE